MALNDHTVLYRLARKVALYILARLNPGDIKIRHHFTGDQIQLHSFRHKGYWFHGKRRESATIRLFEALIHPGQIVTDAGGNIGYMSLLFSRLVGESGQVHVFEPGSNNLKYLRRNVSDRPNITIVEKAVSDKDGTTTFYEEKLTGQNNSLFRDYEVFATNRKYTPFRAKYEEAKVETVSLDTYVECQRIQLDFVKMDVEGAELLALRGMKHCLSHHRPVLMIEITREQEAVYAVLCQNDYAMFHIDRMRITRAGDLRGNTFCIPKESPAYCAWNRL